MPTIDSSKLGYIRVPSRAHDPHLQFAALAAVGVAASQVFSDYAPDTAARRPALTKLLAQIQPGDTLVTWRLDRLSRSTSRLIRLLADLGAKGVWFTAITEAIDTTPPEGHPQLQMFAALAACDHHLRREYTAAGLAAARAQGRLGGRPTVMTAQKLAVVVGVIIAALLFARRVAHLADVHQELIEQPDGTAYAHYRVSGELFFASSSDFYFQFDYAEDPERVVIDLTDSHVWDASTVAALDAVTAKYERHGISTEVRGLNEASTAMYNRLTGQLASH